VLSYSPIVQLIRRTCWGCLIPSTSVEFRYGRQVLLLKTALSVMKIAAGTTSW
jgi:hypothetical protein